MFLEQNRIEGVVVSGSPRSSEEIAAWKRIAEKHEVLFLLEDGEAGAALTDFAAVRVWDRDQFPIVAANIKFALQVLGLEPHHAVFVTDLDEQVEEAIGTRVGVVRIGADIGDHLPDIYLDDIDELAEVLNDRRSGHIHGYLAEVRSTRGNNGARPASTGKVVFGDGILAKRPDLDRKISGRTRVIILGRYFAKQDQRHRKHQLSQRILAAKAGRSPGDVLAQPLGAALRVMAQNMQFDVITRVPPKPSAERDHLVPLIDAAIGFANEKTPPLSQWFEPDAIRCIRDYTSQKEMGGYNARAQNVASAFKADRDLVAGKSVVLVDDILTSGSTATEGARALYAAGASDVSILVLGMDQRVIPLDPEEAVPCPNALCDGSLAVRYNSKDDGAFWGCDKFYETGCRSTTQWLPGLRASNELTAAEQITVWGDVDF